MLKSYAARVLLLCAALAQCGCHSIGGLQEVVLLPVTTGIPFYDEVHGGVAAAVRSCGLRVHYVAPPRADDLQLQIAIFEQSLHSGYGGMILLPVQAQAFHDPVNQAVARGLPMVIVGADLHISSPNVSYLLSDEVLAGRMGAKATAEAVHGVGSIAILGIDGESEQSSMRDRSFESELALRFPRVRIAKKFFASASVTQEQQNALKALAADPSIQALVALNATSTRGAYYALAGRGAKRFHIIGFDQDMLPPVTSGEIDAVVAQRTATIGRIAGELLCDRIARGRRPQSRVELVPPFLLTAATIHSAAAETELGSLWWKPEDE